MTVKEEPEYFLQRSAKRKEEEHSGGPDMSKHIWKAVLKEKR